MSCHPQGLESPLAALAKYPQAFLDPVFDRRFSHLHSLSWLSILFAAFFFAKVRGWWGKRHGSFAYFLCFLIPELRSADIHLMRRLQSPLFRLRIGFYIPQIIKQYTTFVLEVRVSL
jgi:hypothetical protein